MASTPAFLGDAKGTLQSVWSVGKGAAKRLFKSITGGIAIRNAGDTADAELTASKINVSGNDIVMNSDAAGSGADWTITLRVPSSGMSAAWVFTLPVDDGSNGQALFTDGSGNTYWATIPGGVTNMTQVDDTAFAFNTSSPLACMTKPAGTRIPRIIVYVDTAFNDAAATICVGITGTTAKYAGTDEIDLQTIGKYVIYPDADVTVGSEAIIATISAGSATAGAGRIEIDYVLPT